MQDEWSLRKLYWSLFRIWPDGSAVVDARLASTLGLSALNYTSNDSDTQLLLPTGWTWTGVASCVRTVDSVSLDRNIFATLDAPQPSDALKRCITAMEARLADLQATALVDPLTGAFNRRYFDAHAPRLAARCRAAREPLAVLMIDVDNMKQINDANGHTTGDRVLKQLVTRVTSALRPSDLVARMGGDEFTVVMPETDLDAALQIGERLLRRVGDAPIEGATVTVSIGAAVSRPEEEEELEVTLQTADAALYKSKKGGDDPVVG